MSISYFKNTSNIKKIITLICSLIVGLIFIVSGTGKIFGHEALSAQVVDFITSVVPDVLLTPFTVAFLYNIFIPYVFPWAEFILGCFLLIGFVPRLAAALCLPLIFAMVGTNVWAITKGAYATCASCFGMWEQIFGSLNPVQSLIIDAVLLALVLVIIFLHPGRFLSSRAWITYIAQSTIGTSCWNYVQSNVLKSIAQLLKIEVFIRNRPRIAAFGGIGIVGLVLIVYGVVVLFGSQLRTPAQDINPVISDVSVTNISEKSAIISWKTDKPSQNHVLIYNKAGILMNDLTEKTAYTAHLMAVSDLSPGTLYYFQVVSDKKAFVLNLTSSYSFTTIAAAEVPLSISEVGVSAVTGSGATIIWTTNKPATSEVEYWIEGSTNHITSAPGEPVTTHKITLSMLDAGATYHFKVKSTDASRTETVVGEERTITLAADATVVKRAPEFTLNSLNGKTVRLSDYKGKIILLDFWMSSCADCREKMTIFQQALPKLPLEKVAILAIHVEGKESVIQSYVTSEKITVPILLDLQREVSKAYAVTGVPTILLVDSAGFIRITDPEFETAEELIAIFDTMLSTAGHK